jgi:hypothetical protein
LKANRDSTRIIAYTRSASHGIVMRSKQTDGRSSGASARNQNPCSPLSMVLPTTYLLARLADESEKTHCRRKHASERMSKVTLPSNASSISAPDRVSDVLKWILLAVAMVSFVLFS